MSEQLPPHVPAKLPILTYLPYPDYYLTAMCLHLEDLNRAIISAALTYHSFRCHSYRSPCRTLWLSPNNNAFMHELLHYIAVLNGEWQYKAAHEYKVFKGVLKNATKPLERDHPTVVELKKDYPELKYLDSFIPSVKDETLPDSAYGLPRIRWNVDDPIHADRFLNLHDSHKLLLYAHRKSHYTLQFFEIDNIIKQVKACNLSLLEQMPAKLK